MKVKVVFERKNTYPHILDMMTSVSVWCFLVYIILAVHLFAGGLADLSTESKNKYKLLQSAKLLGFQLAEPIPADFNLTYNGNVTDGRNVIYSFNKTDEKRNPGAVRIYSTSKDSVEDYPTVVVIRQERSVMSWQIPLMMKGYDYMDVSRTLCPVDSNNTAQKIYVEFSTQAKQNVSFTLRAELVYNFIIQTNIDHQVNSSPSNPVFYKYTFPKDIESVLVRAKSTDEKCAVLSIQNTKCPIFDLDTDVEYQGKYQTMTTQGAISVEKSEHKSGSFYVVVVVKPNDDDCMDGINQVAVQPTGGATTRKKTVTIHIAKTIPSSQYYKATLAAAAVFIAFYVVAFIIGVCYHGCKENWGIVTIGTFENSMRQEELTAPIADTSGQYQTVRAQDEGNHPLVGGRVRQEGGAQGYGAISNPASNPASRPAADQSHERAEDVQSINSEDYDLVKDADHDKNIFRTKTALFVCDLARKSEKRADKSYKLYCKNLFTIAIFYGLPVIQLVMTYQTVLNFTGDQDICYYNFACAHPLGRVSSFNNIYSNIGYILLGILFLILVARREFLYKKAREMSEGRHEKFGIPQHFGLFYAMGFALCMEGIMSACYHVCPTVSNFQFDTSFMYIIACLCILKIYQNRHPDISAKSHSSYAVMAIVIIIAVIGVVYGTNLFWILFAIAYLLASLLLSIHLYYMGRWKLDRYICKRVWLLIISDWVKCSKPVYPSRLIFLIIGNAVNWGIAIYGVARNKTSDFASYLLSIFISNLILYTIFYIASKWWAKEKIPNLTKAFILIAGVTWGFALYFFTAHLTSWQLSPAGSRAGNQECSLFQFYDKHDIWHFLSAISLFFSFLILLTLDDEIILMRRDKISVF